MARYHLYHWCHVPVPPFIPSVRRPLYSLSCPRTSLSSSIYRSVSLVTLFSLSIPYHDRESWHPSYQRINAKSQKNVRTSTVANLPLDRHIKLVTSVSHQHSIKELGYDTAKKWISESHILNCQNIFFRRSDPGVSISALLGPGPRAVPPLATSRLDWKVLTGLLAWYLETILPCLMTPRGLRGATSGSLGSFLPCTLLFSVPFVLLLCTLCTCGHQTHAHCFTNRAIQRTTTARPDTGHPSHPSPYSDEHRHFAIARPAADSESDVRDAVLRYVAPRLVRRGHDGPRISGQALAAIILCATIVLCALLGGLMQLPALCSCLRGRLLRSDPSTSSAGSIPSSSSGFFDVEMGDQPVSLANGASPPPPYTRAPSYESSGSTAGRGDRTS